ncbi:hypothetical protein QCD79_32860, partial [Pseudomonas quasicaspiana]|nr:hypothetical protein [Pseudomonas quasicaspiana]
RYFHAPLIASLREATFVGVVTRSAERRAELAQDHPGGQAVKSLGARMILGELSPPLCRSSDNADKSRLSQTG